MARGRTRSRGRFRKSSGKQWRANSWSNRIILEPHEIGTIVANELLTVPEYSDAQGVFEDQVQGRATIIRIRGWLDVTFDTTTGNNEVLFQNIFGMYIAPISRAEVDSGVVLDPLEPFEDDAYSFQSIMWTGGGVVQGSFIVDDSDIGASHFRQEIDVPVMRRLEGDEQLYLVGLNINVLNQVDLLVTGVIRTLYRT